MGSQYFLFFTVAFFYIISPGSAVFLSINYGARYGIKKTAVMLLGNSTGHAILAGISALGIGLMIIAAPTLLNTVKLLGACVLTWLGIKMLSWRIQRPKAQKNNTQQRKDSRTQLPLPLL